MGDLWPPPSGAAVWIMPVGSEILDMDGINATWTDGDGVTTSAPHGFVAPQDGKADAH